MEIHASHTFRAVSYPWRLYAGVEALRHLRDEVLERIGKIPLLAFGLGLGEGTGAALAMGIVKAAASVHRDMATFGQAGVSERLS